MILLACDSSRVLDVEKQVTVIQGFQAECKSNFLSPEFDRLAMIVWAAWSLASLTNVAESPKRSSSMPMICTMKGSKSLQISHDNQSNDLARSDCKVKWKAKLLPLPLQICMHL